VGYFLIQLNVHKFNLGVDGWAVCEVWVDRWVEGEVKPKVS